MEDLHTVFSEFKKEFPKIYEMHEALGREIHENSGPLEANTCWLIKVAISASCDHKRALDTHIRKAKEEGVKDEEIKQALLLLIPTAGFPAFMKAYSVFRNVP